jgi:hypothetical protein
MYFPTIDGELLNDRHILRFQPERRDDGSKAVLAIMTDGKVFEIADPRDFYVLDEVRRLAIEAKFSVYGAAATRAETTRAKAEAVARAAGLPLPTADDDEAAKPIQR